MKVVSTKHKKLLTDLSDKFDLDESISKKDLETFLKPHRVNNTFFIKDFFDKDKNNYKLKKEYYVPNSNRELEKELYNIFMSEDFIKLFIFLIKGRNDAEKFKKISKYQKFIAKKLSKLLTKELKKYKYILK